MNGCYGSFLVFSLLVSLLGVFFLFLVVQVYDSIPIARLVFTLEYPFLLFFINDLWDMLYDGII